MKLKEASDRFGRTAAICQRYLEKQGQLKAEYGKVDDATARQGGATKNPLIAAANSRPVGPASATPQTYGEQKLKPMASGEQKLKPMASGEQKLKPMTYGKPQLSDIGPPLGGIAPKSPKGIRPQWINMLADRFK